MRTSVRVSIDDVSVLHYKDNVRLAYGRKPVRYDKCCTACHQLFECTLYAHLCARVD